MTTVITGISRAPASDSESDTDSDSDAPVVLRRTARRAKFTFTCPILSPTSNSPHVPGPTTAGLKRAKGHPDAPSPAGSPEKCRIFKRRAGDTGPLLSQPLFSPVVSPRTHRNAGDVFGPVNPRERTDGYRTDSGNASEGEDAGDAGTLDEYSWGPEDDAPVPPESQMTAGDDSQSEDFSFVEAPATDTDDAAMTSDIESSLPELIDISDSDGESVASGMPRLASHSEPDDESDTSSDDSDTPTPPLHRDTPATAAPPAPPIALAAPTAPSHPERPTPTAAANAKITAYWTVETSEAKAVRLEREARVFAEGSEERRLREVDETRKKTARDRVKGNERMQRHRERLRDAKITEGWIPGMKRTSWSTTRHPLVLIPISPSFLGHAVSLKRTPRRTTSRAAESRK
ncbi:hypothetical protein DFH09DRAFT_1480988 [Mycena vulgaris]|nr:hypothetical protein DFH09DRAFT_1480988 [Mycena vulgaris]